MNKFNLTSLISKPFQTHFPNQSVLKHFHFFSFLQTMKVEMLKLVTLQSQRQFEMMNFRCALGFSWKTITIKERNINNRLAQLDQITQVHSLLWQIPRRLTCHDTRNLKRQSEVVSRLARFCRCRYRNTATLRQILWEEDTH